ncbi:MAG: serine hydroxymethyltransferase [Candidatus Geothermincolia bacterium]
MRHLWETDPEIAQVILDELERQRNKLELIASENFTTAAVLEATASVLTNKYAEGYPGHRHYGGCEYVDVAEELAKLRAQSLFGAEYSNVQPHSGSQANMGVYTAMLKPGDTILGMALAAGGHLTHGATASFSGKLYHPCYYGVNRETEMLDYEEIEKIARECRPKIMVAGASAYSRDIDFVAFRRIADEVGALLLVDMAHFGGLVAAGIHNDPVPLAEFVTGTTHKTLRGPRGGFILCRSIYARDIDHAVFPGIQGGPLMHVIAAKAVAFKEAQGERFRAYMNQVVANARALAAAMSERGYRVVSGGTDTHLLLVDLRPQGLTGLEVEQALDEVGITANKNNVPFDELPPTITSGLRLGTPAMTTRGMKEPEMRLIAELIDTTIRQMRNGRDMDHVTARVRELVTSFPLYDGLWEAT